MELSQICCNVSNISFIETVVFKISSPLECFIIIGLSALNLISSTI